MRLRTLLFFILIPLDYKKSQLIEKVGLNFTGLIINLQLRYVSYQSYNHVILDRLIQQDGYESHRLHRNSINRLIPHKLSRQPIYETSLC